MSPSRPFILRPVATSLLMARSAAGRRSRIQTAARFGAAASGLSDHSGGHVLSRSQPGGDGLVGHRAARAPVRPGARPEPDDVDQFFRRVDHHAPVRARFEYRRGRAAGAGGHQRGGNVPAARLCPNPPIYSKTNPADAPIITLALDLGNHGAQRRWRISPTRALRRKFRSCPASGWSASAAVRSRPCGFRPIRWRCPRIT